VPLRSFEPLRNEYDGRTTIQVFDENVDAIAGSCIDFSPNYIWLNRQLATAAVDKDCQADARRAPKIRELVECRANGSSGKQDVVDNHDVAAIDRARYVGGSHNGPRADCLQIVAVESDIERPSGHFNSVAHLYEGHDSVGELHATPLDPYDHEIFGPAVRFDDLTSHAAEGPLYRTRI
jgi:hypothetical protein